MSVPLAFPQPLWVKADYRQPLLDEYCGNPLIEALPPIHAPEDIAPILHMRPSFDPKELDLPPHIRTHCIKRLKNWIEPRPIYFEVESILASLIRQGYLSRNPLKPTTMRMLHALGRRDPTELSTRLRQSNMAGAFVTEGVSGVGKSTMLEVLLALYPQVIEHNCYQDRAFLQKQITYLIVPCPSEASPRGLCLEFFRAVDEVVGTDYYRQYATSRHGSDVLLIEMALVAMALHIGVLVIDEIQNLKAARSSIQTLAKVGGKGARRLLSPKAQELMNFFVKLINWVGIPTIFVGTGDVMPLFDEAMRYVRRATADGHIVVNPIPPNSSEWNSLVAKLWRYQWLRSPRSFNLKACQTPGSWEAMISSRCHYLSCGIPDVLVKLHMQAQWLALRSECESLDMPLLDEAYDTQLVALHPSLESLRAGGDMAAERYEENYPDQQAMDALASPPAAGMPEPSVDRAGAQPDALVAKSKRSRKQKNAPVNDIQPQFKVSSPAAQDPELTSFDLRTVAGSPDAAQTIRERGIVFALRRLA